ncbi:unnamed protein product, partial [Meganyctiphanes norvegica]
RVSPRATMLFLLIVVFCIQADNTKANECSSPFNPIGNQCLYFGNLILENHENAQAVCQSLGGHLARITEPQQLKDIVDYIVENGYGDVHYWVDGTDIVQEAQWKFSNGEAVPMGTPFWDVDNYDGTWRVQPDNKHGYQNCLQLYKPYHYYFDDFYCNVSRAILCEEKVEIEMNMRTNLEDISCPALFVPVSGMCLAFLTFADQTWDEARQTCASLGGQLAKITQPQHIRDIYLYINQQGLNDDSFWIGGSDKENEGVWKFNDGSTIPSGTPFWGMGILPAQEPDGDILENCLTLFAPGQYYFRDANCDNIFNPLCSINPI